MTATMELPTVPAKHADFISYVQSQPDKPLPELLEPYKQYDAKLREVFAQDPEHSALKDQYLNVVPVFKETEHGLKIRARDMESESIEEKERYVMPLSDTDRHPDGSPATVESIDDFQQNFALFCESSLVDLDWSNVVAAGSSVVTSLLPVPEKHKKSKRALRNYYHEMLAPASDVDLFLYGLSEEDAVKKIIEIEQRIKDSILTETTTIRTKNAITIASQYPTRHIQIVLRIYKSVSEILTGFDVDCSCAAYDGKQVWAAPRALTAYMTQTNTVDLTRRSPSYENRLSKYSHRGFEVYWPLLERSRIDPTIFERNFARTVGLARLLVLERLPSKSERESYMDERRRERGRPAINRHNRFVMRDNIKDAYEDEVAEWVDQEDVSDYHTFTIPYGPKYHAKNIEKLLYTKDLLLNAEWNKREDREVTLHRHPAFFGYAEDVIRDCCGFCPKPITQEDFDAAEEEAKIYVSGEISFIKDDAGRQAIGSFHPITDDDWTEMAYVGNTARLCQAIVDHDLEHVEDWLSQEGSDPDCRDYTGRTPLHLAVSSSSPEIVRSLIDHGARLVARLADGRTALHLAATRGNVEMVKMILQKSEENEEAEAEKEDIRKQTRIAAREGKNESPDQTRGPLSSDAEDSDLEMIEKDDISDEDAQTTTTGSFLKVKEQGKKSDDLIPDEEEDEPDVYDVNVEAWDTKCSPLHLAILNGHVEVVKELVQTFGADLLLPIKLFNDLDKTPRGAILTLVLSLSLPLEKAKAMTKVLLELGASCAQADNKQTTAFHFISVNSPDLLETMIRFDEPAAKRAINHLSATGYQYRPQAHSPLMSAIREGNALAVLKLLEFGAFPHINFNDWMKSVEAQWEQITRNDSTANNKTFLTDIEQPIILAVQNELPEVVTQLLCMDVDINVLTTQTHQGIGNSWQNYPMESLLDVVRKKLADLKHYEDRKAPTMPELKLKEGFNYLDGIEPASYKFLVAQTQLENAQVHDKYSIEMYQELLEEHNSRIGVEEKQKAIDALAEEFKKVEQILVGKGAKTFKELYPDETISKRPGPGYFGNTRSPQKPFEITFDFSVHDLTDEKREAYLKLFQAAWDADLDTVKSLTLAPWGDASNTPLKITVQDKNAQSPYSLAILRGHHDVARAIVEISFAQYQPPEEEAPKRYRLADEDDDDASDAGEIGLYREIADDKFTIDNIGELSMQVQSTTTPIAFMSFECSVWNYAKHFLTDKKYVHGVDDAEVVGAGNISLQSWAISINDKALFSFLLDLDLEWTDKLANKLDGSSGIPSFTQHEFDLAIRYGRTDLLAEMIKHAGAGMELESLVKKSGVKYREAPKYYQGLSVHGKKRSDWINAARGTYVRQVTDTNPPLLRAAFKGSLQSVEWFLSDAPSRHYLDFAEAYKDDKLITHLNKSAGGFGKVLRTWLNARRELALHCAVMAGECSETSKLIQYLVKVMPESLELRSIDGFTPLALAFSLQRLDAAKILIEAGALQTSRDRNGSNILHLLLAGPSREVESVQPFYDLIDKRVLPSLLTERSMREPGSLTPLASWLQSATDDKVEFLSAALELASSTGNEHLELLDGSGETPMHHAVKMMHQSLLKTMLKYRPDLLYRENSVGRTPFELAEDAYITDSVRSAPSAVHHSFNPTNAIASRSAETFAPDYAASESVSRESMWQVCKQHMVQHPNKRKLVSLLDANEVAKRLSARKSSKQHGSHADNESDAGSNAVDSNEMRDEVQQWYSPSTYHNHDWQRNHRKQMYRNEYENEHRRRGY